MYIEYGNQGTVMVTNEITKNTITSWDSIIKLIAFSYEFCVFSAYFMILCLPVANASFFFVLCSINGLVIGIYIIYF